MREVQSTPGDVVAVQNGQAQLHERILECISEGVVVADCGGRILVSNDAARRHLGAGSEGVPLVA